ncbi:orotate phosphoribosyltransferase [Candidatus Woesearchaeota archaeon]|nr:orotate phosphoribosyltransferase [Candidatus Woesearchaeota archaeon]
MSGEKIAALLLNSGAVMLRPKQPFRYASGLSGPIYCDNRILLSRPHERKVIVNAFIELLEGDKPDVIAGVATGSIAWAAMVADKLGKPMVYIRKESKDHGKGNLIEGVLDSGQEAVVVEDLVTTGGSSLSAVSAARNHGAVVKKCLAIFTYGLESSKKGFNNAGCQLITLTDFDTLVKVAFKSGFISSDDRAILMEWKSDPEGWGRTASQNRF